MEIEALKNRLRKKIKHLTKWANKKQVTCYRLFHHDIPEWPMVMDYIDGHVVVWFSRKIDEESEIRSSIEAIVGELLEVNPTHIFFKQRGKLSAPAKAKLSAPANAKLSAPAKAKENENETSTKPGNTSIDAAQPSKNERAGNRKTENKSYKTIVEENGLKFELNLSDYLDIGLFLDHRPARELVKSMAHGKAMLNLFAYTGSFTCYAIDGFASTTTTVDLNPRYCEWASKNLALNGWSRVTPIKIHTKQNYRQDFNQCNTKNKHMIVQDDCLHFLDHAPSHMMYDIIVCDPPTFSNSKRKHSDTFSIKDDYPMLIQKCLDRLNPNGKLLFSNNAKSFELDEKRLPKNIDVKNITHQTLDEDFRKTNIHKAWMITKY